MAIFDLEYFKRGVIGAYITSPGGTESQVLLPRQLDALAGYTPYKNVTTVSVHFWGEQAKGTWTISIKNDLTSQGTGRGKMQLPFLLELSPLLPFFVIMLFSGPSPKIDLFTGIKNLKGSNENPCLRLERVHQNYCNC